MAIHHKDTGPEPQKTVRRWPPVLAATVSVACLSAVVVLGLILPAFRPASTSSEGPYDLQGSVSTLASGSRPVSITFTSQKEIMQLTAPVKDNQYEIELPGGNDSFEVEVNWNSLPDVTGTCYAGTIHYNTSEAPIIHDIKC